jgi:transcriptional regulator GlxA family with amidase domain
MECELYRELFDLVDRLCQTIILLEIQQQFSKESVVRSRELVNNGRLIPRNLRRISSNGPLSSKRLKRVWDYIESHLDERLTLVHLARVACLSPCHFSKSFKRAVGVGPHRYLQQRRLERAKVLMCSTDEPLVRIAQETGFSDQSHLTLIFRRETGMTPSKYRTVVGRKLSASQRTVVACGKPETHSKSNSSHTSPCPILAA